MNIQRFYARIAAFSCLALICVPTLSAQLSEIQQTIFSRYEQILRNEVNIDSGEALEFARTLGSDGTWPDISYITRKGVGWEISIHLGRVRSMAMAATGGELSADEEAVLVDAVRLAIDNWVQNRYWSPNWWNNEIGNPQLARDIAVVLRNRLDAETMDKALSILGQYRIGEESTGANRTWAAELGFFYGCFKGDSELMKHASQLVWDEIVIGAHEGVQTDWSYFQHDERVQTWVYGKSFLEVIAKLAWQLRGTEWEVPLEKRRIIDGYIINGMQWMTRGLNNSPVGLDRAIARPGRLRSSDVRLLVELWSEVSTENREGLKAFVARQNGELPMPSGFRYFNIADYAAYHHPSASIMLKTLSTRTELTETLSGENLIGWAYVSTGDHYVISNGKEYLDLPGVWNWKQLPGITVAGYETVPVRKDFVGGLSDGQQGFAVMDYARARTSEFVETRKLWAFKDDIMLCVLGGWNYTDNWGQITTAIEQCLVQGEVLYSMEGKVHAIADNAVAQTPVEWVLHNNIGYIPLNPAEIRLQVGPHAGTWRDDYRTASPKIESHQVLSILLEHTIHPKPSGYVIVLDATPEKLTRLVQSPPFQILRNQRSAQVVRFPDGTYMAAFYDAFDLPAEDGSTLLRVNRPAVAMWDSQSLHLADPLHKGGEVRVLWEDHELAVTLPNDGSSITTQR